MPSCTDTYGRTITLINPQPGDPKIVRADPTFDTDVDQLMDVMDSGGILWFVMNYGTVLPLFLAFEFRETVTLDALDAAQRLKRRFEVDADLRQQMVDFALSIGTAFHEFGSANMIWRTPDNSFTAA